MIRLRWTSANALPVTISPPFEDRAKAATARSISPASRTLTGVNSTPNAGAADWIAPNWPVPADIPASRMTATRVTPGAICLSSLQPFAGQTVFVIEETGDIAARSCQALDEACADRICDIHQHDRHAAGRPLQLSCGRGATRQDNVRRERDQFRRESADAVGIARTPAVLDPHVAAVDPAQLVQSLLERGEACPDVRIVRVRSRPNEHPDAPHSLALLRARRERPRRRAAKQRDELASSHSITSSARASSVVGTSMPSVLAVMRLITSSNLVGS